MSDRILPKDSTASFHRYNWRKILSAKVNYNCPCRGNKPPYTVKQSFLSHYKSKHPQQYESLKDALAKRRRRRNRQASAIKDSSNNSYGSSSHMASDSDKKEIQIIFEHPEISADEALEEKEELPSSATYNRADQEAEDVKETYREDYSSDSETEKDVENCQYAQDMQQYVNTIAPISSIINQAEEQSSLLNARQAIDTQNEEL